ncbi:MAG: 2TM domain-containing protein [Acidimicrobiia bacterium]|nr:2TM domain-containing protein [Acidimicrobiia bacterium]
MSRARDRHADIATTSPSRRHAMKSGLYMHLAIFAAAMLVLFMLNANTRGPDGEWWVLWPLELWCIAWGLHIWGVSVGSSIAQTAE